MTWRVVAVLGPLGATRPALVRVDGETYVEALELLGGAWECGTFIRWRAAASYVANVEPTPLDLRDWIAGRAAFEGDRYRSIP